MAARVGIHPAKLSTSADRVKATRAGRHVAIPEGINAAELTIGTHRLSLTNLQKPFWPELGIRKRDLLQYYADVAKVLLPHLSDRAMVMKRYPNGANGEFFFQKRAPSPRP